MILDERSIALLSQIINSNQHILLKQLQENLNISRRTIYYDLEKINNWLEFHGMHKVKNTRNLGLIIDEDSKTKIRELITDLDKEIYIYSHNERKAIIFIYLCFFDKKKLIINDFISVIDVCRNTIISDIKELKEELKPFRIQLKYENNKGYYIQGNERNIRNTLSNYVEKIIKKNRRELLVINDPLNREVIFKKEIINKIIDIIYDIEKIIGVQFTDKMIFNIAVRFYTFVNRIKNNRYVDMDEAEVITIKKTKEYLAAKYICNELEKLFDVVITEMERSFFTIYLLSAKIFKDKFYLLEEDKSKEIKNAIILMTEEFEKNACVNLYDKEILLENLYLHLKTAYYRVKYGITFENPLTQIIKQKYAEIYKLTKKVIHHFVDITETMPSDDEISYVAIHFGAWLNSTETIQDSDKQILIVCHEGIGVSKILENQLNELLAGLNIAVKTKSIRDYEKMEKVNANLMISTIHLNAKNVPIYLVNSILSNEEKKKLISFIYKFFSINNNGSNHTVSLMNIIKKNAIITDEKRLIKDLNEHLYVNSVVKKEKQPMLNELIKSSNVQIIQKAENWEEAIEIAAQPLVLSNHIKKSYVQAMIDNVKEMGPYIVIGPKVAIPHARPEEGVVETSMSLLRIKESVSFSEKEEHKVNLVIILASKDNIEHLKALSQLSKILTSEENRNKLIYDADKEEIVKIIDRYSK